MRKCVLRHDLRFLGADDLRCGLKKGEATQLKTPQKERIKRRTAVGLNQLC